MSSLRRHCQCEFSRNHIMGGGFQCFADSENHVVFRARLRGVNQKNSLQLMTSYLEDVLVSARSWLIHGQYLKVNHSCSLIIIDIHSPECFQFNVTSSPPVSHNDITYHAMITNPIATEQGISCNIGYLTWALSSTLLLLILMAIVGVLFSAKVLKSKASNMNYR